MGAAETRQVAATQPIRQTRRILRSRESEKASAMDKADEVRRGRRAKQSLKESPSQPSSKENPEKGMVGCGLSMNTADKTRAETQTGKNPKVSDNESKGKEGRSEERESDEPTCDNEKKIETHGNDGENTDSTPQKESLQKEP